MFLTNSKIKITCIHLETQEKYDSKTISFYAHLKDMYDDKIDIQTNLDSVNETFDLIHIHSHHIDFKKLQKLMKKNTIIIYNYTDSTNKLWNNYISQYDLRPLDISLHKTNLQDIKYVQNIKK